MSSLQVSGPTSWFTQTNAGAYEFLGFCEGDTRISFDGQFEDVTCDASGTRLPFDVAFMGEQAFTSGDLVLSNEAVYQKVAARIGPAADVPGVYGAGGSGAIGLLMGLEGGAYGLVIKSPYAGKAVFTSVGMVPGFVFPRSYLADQIDVSLSTKRTIRRLVFRSLPAWNISTSSYTLFTTTLPTLPAVA
jgi:hypothetical protein